MGNVELPLPGRVSLALPSVPAASPAGSGQGSGAARCRRALHALREAFRTANHGARNENLLPGSTGVLRRGVVFCEVKQTWNWERIWGGIGAFFFLLSAVSAVAVCSAVSWRGSLLFPSLE